MKNILNEALEDHYEEQYVPYKIARRILKALKKIGQENCELAKGRKSLIPLSAPPLLKRARDQDDLDLPSPKNHALMRRTRQTLLPEPLPLPKQNVSGVLLV